MVKYISLVNLIMGREVVKELIQDDFNKENLIKELGLLLEEGPHRSAMIGDLSSLRKLLGPAGASERAAVKIVEYLRSDYNT